MEQQRVVRVRCQRIGCDATFTDDDNPEGSCRYHEAPTFHDGIKEWSCCKKRSHDFSEFLQIPGCKTGKHTAEKPVSIKPPASQRIPISVPGPVIMTNTSLKESCSRCRQGFFCSDHGSHVKDMNSKPVNAAIAAPTDSNHEGSTAPAKKIVDINQPQICRNKGCGKMFKEKENHESACYFHPGPAVFHDRMRGWKCCNIHVKEFDEFMDIPPCTKGWHNADMVS